ncbi:hypothetical protein B0A55_02908 [Friedmanniomyces simplex]|uniref:Uncharacterized protein n=1 Tax=Friedmanniomyces simplex TaxID=329884 RepID=A0A4U0XSI1_9PEZI|nr:hypothetical protein B0A55_02908 [Friedmanniomyces simplex]
MSGTPGGQGSYQQHNQQWAYNDGRNSVQYHQQTTVTQSASSTPALVASPYQAILPAPMQQMLPAPDIFQQHHNMHNAAMQQAAQFHASATHGMFSSMQQALPAPMTPFPQQTHMLPPTSSGYPQAQVGYGPTTPMPQVQSPGSVQYQPHLQSPAARQTPMPSPYPGVQQRGTQQVRLPAPRTPGFVLEAEASSSEEESSEDEEEEERQKAEAERRRVDEERRRVDEDRRRAEDDRRRKQEELDRRAADEASKRATQRAMQEQLRRIEDQSARDRKEREAQSAKERKEREARDARDAQAARDRQDREDREARDRTSGEAREREEREKKDLEVAKLQSKLNAERKKKDRELAMVQSRLDAEREKKGLELAMMQSRLDAERQEKLDQERKNSQQLAAFADKAATPQPTPMIDLSPLQTVLAELSAHRLQKSDIATLVEDTMVRQLRGVARAEDLASSTSKVQKALNKLPASATAADVQKAVERGIDDVMQKASGSQGRRQQAAIEAKPSYRPNSWDQQAGQSRVTTEYTVEEIPDDRSALLEPENPVYSQSAASGISSSKSRALPAPAYPAYARSAAPEASSSKSRALPAPEYGAYAHSAASGASSSKSRALQAPEHPKYPQPSSSKSQASKDRSSVYVGNDNALAEAQRPKAPSRDPEVFAEHAMSLYEPSEAGSSKSKTRGSVQQYDGNALAKVKQSRAAPSEASTALTEDALAKLTSTQAGPSKSRSSRTRSLAQPRDYDAMTQVSGSNPPPYTEMADPSMDQVSQKAVERGIDDVMQKASGSQGRRQQAAIEAKPSYQPNPWDQQASQSRVTTEYTVEEIPDDQPFASASRAPKSRALPAPEYPAYPQSVVSGKSSAKSRALPAPEYPAYPQPAASVALSSSKSRALPAPGYGTCAQSAAPGASSSKKRALPAHEYPAYPQSAAPQPSSLKSQASKDRSSVYGGNDNALVKAQRPKAPSRDPPPFAEHAMSLYEPSEAGSSKSGTRGSVQQYDDNALAKTKRFNAAPSEASTALTEDALAKLTSTQAGPSKSRSSRTRSLAQPRDYDAMTQVSGSNPPPYTEMADPSMDQVSQRSQRPFDTPEIPTPEAGFSKSRSKTRRTVQPGDDNAVTRIKRSKSPPADKVADFAGPALTDRIFDKVRHAGSGVFSKKSTASVQSSYSNPAVRPSSSSSRAGPSYGPYAPAPQNTNNQLSPRGGTSEASAHPELPDDFPDNASQITAYERAQEARSTGSRSGMTDNRTVETLKPKNDRRAETAVVKGKKDPDKKGSRR